MRPRLTQFRPRRDRNPRGYFPLHVRTARKHRSRMVGVVDGAAVMVLSMRFLGIKPVSNVGTDRTGTDAEKSKKMYAQPNARSAFSWGVPLKQVKGPCRSGHTAKQRQRYFTPFRMTTSCVYSNGIVIPEIAPYHAASFGCAQDKLREGSITFPFSESQGND